MALTKVTSALTNLDGGITIDNITIDGTEIDLSSGDLTIDVAGDITLDADGGHVFFKDAGTQIGKLQNSSSDFIIESSVQDKDIIFKGDDGGSTITALTLDMSAAGFATFNSGVKISGDSSINRGNQTSGELLIGGTTDGGFVDFDGTALQLNTQRDPNTGTFINTAKSHSSIILSGADGGSHIRFTTASANNTTATERMRIASNGQVMIARSSAVSSDIRLNLTADASVSAFGTENSGTGNNYIGIFRNSGGTLIGSIIANNGAVAFNTSSDYRLKENVDYTWDATTRLKQLKPARFNFKSDETNTLVDGFLAHEVSSIVPEAITGEKDGAKMQGIDQSKLVPLLVKTIQELEARITTLEG